MKTAKATIVSIWLDCPNGCEDSIISLSSGSLRHEVDVLSETIVCRECGEELKVPKWVFNYSYKGK